MAENEKGRPVAEGSPIPNYVLTDNSDHGLVPRNLQVIRLTRRCAISAAMASTIAPLVFGEASR